MIKTDKSSINCSTESAGPADIGTKPIKINP